MMESFYARSTFVDFRGNSDPPEIRKLLENVSAREKEEIESLLNEVSSRFFGIEVLLMTEEKLWENEVIFEGDERIPHLKKVKLKLKKYGFGK